MFHSYVNVYQRVDVAILPRFGKVTSKMTDTLQDITTICGYIHHNVSVCGKNFRQFSGFCSINFTYHVPAYYSTSNSEGQLKPGHLEMY